MILYHYTDQNGFIGIFENQELWATKIQYLNDASEYIFAHKLAEKCLNLRLNNTESLTLKKRLQYYIDIIDDIKNTNTCVCSLTENGDLLSQWRGYSRSLGGYSIGFSYVAIEPYIRLQNCKLVKCIYSADEQKIKMFEIIDYMIENFMDESEPDYKMPVHYDSGEVFKDKLSEIAPAMKDASFKEEAEWRILSTVNFEELSFRTGSSMLTPYIKINLDSSKNNDFDRLVSEVIVGHTPHPDLAVKATEAFILKHIPPHDADDYQCPIDVKKSSIPFRNW